MGREPDTNVDFGKLNAAERTALNLLAQGHTAKSIANLTDRSVGAVNERLREARRKTGVGSSRELARLFAAQENRDQLIGVAPVVGAAPDPSQPAAKRRRWKGITFMVVMLAGALSIAALTLPAEHSAGPASKTSSESPSLDPTYWNDAYWHRRVMTEARDAGWAPEAERALHAWLATVPDVEDRDHPMEVHCASTACEVNGTLLGGDQRVSIALDKIQTRAGPSLTGATPLSIVSFSFIMDDGKLPGFRIHYRRDVRAG